VGSEGFTLSLSKNFINIKTPNCKYHKQILNYLNESELPFHTFAPLHVRPIVAIIRYLHHFISLDDINTSLMELGFSARSAGNIINRTNNQPIMSLFTMLSFITTILIGINLNCQNFWILKPSKTKTVKSSTLPTIQAVPVIRTHVYVLFTYSPLRQI